MLMITHCGNIRLTFASCPMKFIFNEIKTLPGKDLFRLKECLVELTNAKKEFDEISIRKAELAEECISLSKSGKR